MNQNQLLSLIRFVGASVGGALVAQGKLEQSDLDTALGAIIALVSVAWSMLHHKTPPAPEP